MNKTLIYQASVKDVQQIVEVHLKSFPGFFLTYLGYGFLSVFYSASINDKTSIAYVAEDNNKIIGFVLGTKEPKGYYSRLLKQNWGRFGLASIWPLIKRPSIAPRLLRAYKMPSINKDYSDNVKLMSLAVTPDAQGRGIGKELVKAFIKGSLKHGASLIYLTTDKEDNEYVNRFYLSQGFLCDNSYVTPEGRKMNIYIFDLHKVISSR